MGGSLRNRFIRRLRCLAVVTNWTAPKCCIETGTYRGDSTVVLAVSFDAVHTIELSEKWFLSSRKRLLSCSNVTCHQGDSASVIKELIPVITEPIVFFLDAHFAGGDTAFGAEEVPLLRELEVLHSRTEKDIIVIDDLRLIGKHGVSGKLGHPIYPKMEFDWRAVSIAAIEKSIGRGHCNPWLFGRDSIVILRNLSYLQGCVVRVLLALHELGRSVKASSNELLERISRAFHQSGNDGKI